MDKNNAEIKPLGTGGILVAAALSKFKKCAVHCQEIMENGIYLSKDMDLHLVNMSWCIFSQKQKSTPGYMAKMATFTKKK